MVLSSSTTTNIFLCWKSQADYWCFIHLLCPHRYNKMIGYLALSGIWCHYCIKTTSSKKAFPHVGIRSENLDWSFITRKLVFLSKFTCVYAYNVKTLICEVVCFNFLWNAKRQINHLEVQRTECIYEVNNYAHTHVICRYDTTNKVTWPWIFSYNCNLLEFHGIGIYWKLFFHPIFIHVSAKMCEYLAQCRHKNNRKWI